MMATRCLLAAMVLCAVSGISTGLNVAAFNIKWLGTTKVRDAAVRNIIAKIIMRYDILLIQEIRGNATYVVGALEQEISNLGGSYAYVYSAKLGRTRYTETYAYFYKKRTVEILEVYQYDDGPDDGRDAFEREPFAVHIHPKCEPDLTNFTIMGIHVKPSHAPEELRELFSAFQTVIAHFNNNRNALLIGDLNADCNFITLAQLRSLALRAHRYWWMIRDYDDTTLGYTDCAYDRIIVSGITLQAAVLTSPSHVFRFDLAYGLTVRQAKAVSDHYPVFVELAIAT